MSVLPGPKPRLVNIVNTALKLVVSVKLDCDREASYFLLKKQIEPVLREWALVSVYLDLES